MTKPKPPEQEELLRDDGVPVTYWRPAPGEPPTPPPPEPEPEPAPPDKED
jgi:hypothetical protein